MATHDLQGRAYAKLSELKAGDYIQTDGDFTCRHPWALGMVHVDDDGCLYITCDKGDHWLDGQLDDDGDTLVGVYKKGVV